MRTVLHVAYSLDSGLLTCGGRRCAEAVIWCRAFGFEERAGAPAIWGPSGGPSAGCRVQGTLHPRWLGRVMAVGNGVARFAANRQRLRHFNHLHAPERRGQKALVWVDCVGCGTRQVVAVADGVAGWWEEAIDSGVYSRQVRTPPSEPRPLVLGIVAGPLLFYSRQVWSMTSIVLPS